MYGYIVPHHLIHTIGLLDHIRVHEESILCTFSSVTDDFLNYLNMTEIGNYLINV